MEDIAETPTPLHETRDVAQPLYAALDWRRTVVAGSYALQHYLRAWSWSPGDIDVMVQARSHDDFLAELDRVTRALPGATLVKPATLLTDAQRQSPMVGREERFHEAILATATLAVPGIPLPMQLVGIELTPNHAQGAPEDLLGQLNRITDLPACVTYTVRDHERIFHVPERGLHALRTGEVPVVHICAARRSKYEARGFVFIDA
jgi:hypothetical protein